LCCCLLECRELAEQQVASLCRQARFTQTVERERLGDTAGTRPGEDQPEPEVPIGRPADRFVEAAVLQEPFTADCGQPEDEVALDDRASLVGNLETPRAVVVPADDPIAYTEVSVGRQDVEIRTSLCERAQRIQTFAEVDVVGIENCHEIACGCSCGCVLGGGLAAVFLAQEHDRVAVRLDRAFRDRRSTRRRRRSPRAARPSAPESTSTRPRSRRRRCMRRRSPRTWAPARLDASCRRSEKLARRFARPGEVWPTVGGSSVQVASAGSTRARARRSEGRLQRRRQRYVTAWRRLGCVRLRARGSWRRASVPGAPPPPR
jgi:hypothetical protein